MVLYFSATGNTEYIAKSLAGVLKDDCLDLLPRIRKHDYSALYSKTPFVICSPVYVCELPRFLTAYLKKTSFKGNRRVYFVFTSGGYAGISGIIAKRIFAKKHMIYKGRAEFRMPGNYIASNMYPAPTDEEIKKIIRESSAGIPELADSIRKGRRLKGRRIQLWEILVTLPFNPVWCLIKQPTKKFYATDRCISCRKCEQVCPLGVIHMKKGRPVWVRRTCSHCMSCIQNCPAEAIEYGNITQGKRRYLLGKYL